MKNCEIPKEVKDIIEAYRQFIEEGADILISACPARKNPYFNMIEVIEGRIQKVKHLDKNPVRRQDAPQVYDMKASIYIWKRYALLGNDTLYTDKTSLYIMPEERSVDIDSKLDWEFVEFMIYKSRENND